MNSQKKKQLRERIRTLEGLTADERSALLGLLAETKPYGLVWEEKPEDVEESLRDELPILCEVPERAIISDNPAAPNHILIEGDNLEALSTLAYTHEGKIDVIYIDPPYNTGNKDFVYNDSFVDREDAFRHSKWLSFMAKRLRIAKKLLSERGVIFISIDDNEQAQLKLLCDEVFGEGNFVGQLILKTATDNNPSQINTEHEYMLCYCFAQGNQGNWQRTSTAANLVISKYKELKTQFEAPDIIQKELRKWIKTNKVILPQVAHYNNVDERGVYSSSSNSSNPHPGGYTYDIFHPITHLPCPKPENGWRWPETTFKAYDDAGEIAWGIDESTQPHVKKRIETSTEYLRTLIYEDNRGTTKELADIFGGEKRFDNPKPNKVLSRIFDFASCPSSTVLDFFAGSGTTLHAVMQLNAEDGGNRQCILVTNNENGICENVTYERNRRVIQGYTTPKGEAREGLTANTLRYYKTDFISRSRSVRNMRQLVRLATDMLCIKENIYTETAEFGGQKTVPVAYRAFREGDRQMLVVYREEAVEDLAEMIYGMEVREPIIVYVFSPSEDAWSEQWEDVQDKVRPTALPAAIYNTYKRILPKKRDTPLAPEGDALDGDDETQSTQTTLFDEEDMV